MLLGFLVVLTVAEAVPVLLNTTSVVDPIPVLGGSLLADEKTGPYRLTFFKSAIGTNKDTNNENNKTVEVLMNKSNEERNQTVNDESSMEENDPIEMKFSTGDWSKKLTKIIDKDSSSVIDSSSSSSSSSSEEDSSSSSEEDSSGNGSGDSSEEEEEEEGSEEESGEESGEEEEEGGSEEEEEENEEEEEEEEKEIENEKEEEKEIENEEEEEEEKEIEKVLNVDIKKTSVVITPAGTQLMKSSDDDVFPEMQRLHKKFRLTTKGTRLLFTDGFYSHHLIQDNSIIPSSSLNPSVVQQSASTTTPSSSNVKTMYSDWLKSLPEMKKFSLHPHFISSSSIVNKPINKNKADDDVNQSSGNQLTPGGTRLVSDDHHWLSLYNGSDFLLSFL